MNWKSHILKGMYGRWPATGPLMDGYCIMVLVPSDMPFLLQVALEGIASTDTTNCRQILVVRDPFAEPQPGAIARICRENGDPRIGTIQMGFKDSLVAKHVSHAVHWLQVVNGIRATRCRYAFLHDADAFFCQADALEQQYLQCRDKGYYALGVEARADEFFKSRAMDIPGTWELMFDVEWARRYTPYFHRGIEMDTPAGRHVFDNTLYPQYLDYRTGKVGIMSPVPQFVHYNGTIFQYRRYRNFPSRFEDEYCRVLLLSLLERCLSPDCAERWVTPSPELLARGLRDSEQPVTYLAEGTALRYDQIMLPTMERMLRTPLFAGKRSEQFRELIRPFHEYFLSHPAVRAGKLAPPPDIRDLLRGSSAPQEHQLDARSNVMFGRARSTVVRTVLRAGGGADALGGGYAAVLPSPTLWLHCCARWRELVNGSGASS